MKLLTADLKLFKAKSAAIPPNTMLPILSYLKFEKGKVTKNSLNSFITMDIACDGEFLIDEKQLMAFVAYTKDDIISVTKKCNSVLISDSTAIKYTSPTEPMENFPTNDMPLGSDWVEVNQGVLNDLAIASLFNIENELNPVMSNVYIGNGYVAGTDGIIAFMRKREMKDCILQRKIADTIGKLTSVTFNENESYHFFSSGSCQYGFVKPEAKMTDFRPFVADLSGSESFLISKKLIIDLNELAITRSPLPNVLGTMIAKEDNLHFDFVDSDYELSLSHDLPCKGNITEPFRYNASIMNRILKALPDDMLRFSFHQNKMYVTNDNNSFISLIMRLKD